MYGSDATSYAANATNCFIQGINLVQYDIDLLVIKYMYGDTEQNVLNTTLFLKNVSDVSYVCIDALENLYVFAMFKYDKFGQSNTNVILGFIQNLLGKVLTINKIYQKVIEYTPEEEPKLYYDGGRIA